MKIGGVIIAGGSSLRMGQEKALLVFRGETLLQRTISRLVPQVTDLALNANGDPQRFASSLTILPDLHLQVGTPLAGLHAGLSWVRQRGYDALLSVPSDCPFLPPDLVSRLAETYPRPAIAASGGLQHFLTGLWPGTLLERLERAITEDGVFRVKDWAALAGANPVEWPTVPFDPLLNINTPDDLEAAKRWTG